MIPFYKICTKQTIHEAEKKGFLVHPSLQAEGFIHAAYLHQLPQVIAKHYSHQTDLLLLKINPYELTSPWKSEDLKQKGEAFPHVYGPINWDAIVEVVPIEQLELRLKQFPMGECPFPKEVDKASRNQAIESIQHFPIALKQLLNEKKEEELNKKYREVGWTIQQIVHHCADSHMSSFLRFKWALTEERPIIKPYREEKWAEFPDSKKYDVWTSVKLLETLHERWTYLLKHMSETDFSKSFIHPESQKTIRLDQNVIMFEWHGKHHLAHIQAALQQNII